MAMHTEELALFSSPPTNSGIERTQWITYYPVSQSLSEGPIEYYIAPNSVHYTDLFRTKLQVKAKIELANGGRISPGDKVSFVNIPIHALWSQVDVFLQQQAVSTGAGSNYPIKAYLETLLGYGEDAKESKLTSSLYYADSGNVDDTDPVAGSNIGLIQRWTYTKGGAVVDMESHIHHDLCLQRRLILNGVGIGLKFWQSKDAFRLMTSDKGKSYKVTLLDVHLKVARVTLAPQVLVAHSQVLATTTAKYPYQQSQIKVFNINEGQFSAIVEDPFNGGRCPCRLLVAMTSARAYNGHLEKNPFNLKHYSTSFVAFYKDGESVPSQPLRMDFENNQYIEAYQSIFLATGRDRGDVGNEIDRHQYKNGNTIFGFLVQPDAGPELEYLPVESRGHTRFEIKFARPLPEPIVVIFYGVFPGLLEIDCNRDVIQQ